MINMKETGSVLTLVNVRMRYVTSITWPRSKRVCF